MSPFFFSFFLEGYFFMFPAYKARQIVDKSVQKRYNKNNYGKGAYGYTPVAFAFLRLLYLRRRIL